MALCVVTSADASHFAGFASEKKASHILDLQVRLPEHTLHLTLQEDSPDAQEASLRSAIAAYFHNDLAAPAKDPGKHPSPDLTPCHVCWTVFMPIKCSDQYC